MTSALAPVQPSADRPQLPHRVVSLRCRIWSLSGHSGHQANRANQVRSMSPHLAHLLQRASHRIDHTAGQEIHRGFAAELIARAAFDQPRSKTALDRRADVRSAGLGPDQPQFWPGVFRDHFPIQRNGAGVVRQRPVLCGVGRDGWPQAVCAPF